MAPGRSSDGSEDEFEVEDEGGRLLLVKTPFSISLDGTVLSDEGVSLITDDVVYSVDANFELEG
jgi:hypothetical protein